MLGIHALGKSYGARSLFAEVTLTLNGGSRYGLVGANGSGKTTFLSILAGDEPASDGTMSLPKEARMGVLRQDQFVDGGDRILDVAMSGDERVFDALAEQRRLVEDHSPDAARIAELEDLVAMHDGYTLEARASQVLEGLGIPQAQQKLPLATLSGGFRLRVLLARILIGNPDVLLLDEPTNHLDILSIRWLEKYLSGFGGCAIIISHDQRFLDNVVTHVLDVDYGTITAYVGNYTAFVVEKADTRARKEAEIARAEAIVADKKAWVERFGAKATKARQAQSRLKQIEKIEIEELEGTSRRTPRFLFEPLRPSGREVLEVEGVDKSYGPKVVLRDVSVLVRRGERLAVIGPNGLGKSTLLKIAVGVVPSDRGAAKWGHEARVGYFAQDHHEILADPEATPLSVIWDTVPKEPTTYVRGQLGRALFSGEDVEKKVGSLSGGEAARLVFCRLMVERPNVLVLDEPTNHLDLEAIAALAEALESFEGTVIFVSHDRWFVSRLATRILELTPTGPRDFPGTYAEYLERCGDDHLDAETVVLKSKQAREDGEKGEKGEKKATSESSLAWEEQKKKKNRQKQLPAIRDQVVANIDVAEARKAAIQAKYCEPGFYEKTSKDELAALAAEETALGTKVDALTAEWEALETELATGG